ncbi:MAG: hypothetical protein EXR77_20385 [Myxococcales bacterium]|nr:hypothetical protein [Myxococcales bacterium]
MNYVGTVLQGMVVRRPWTVVAFSVLLVCGTGGGGRSALAASPPAETVASAPVSPALVQEARDLAKVARKLYEAKHYGAAAELYRKAFRLDPDKPDYLYGVGRAEQRAGKHADAKVAFEQLISLLPVDDPLAARAKRALAELQPADSAVDPPKDPSAAEGPAVPPAALATPTVMAATATPTEAHPALAVPVDNLVKNRAGAGPVDRRGPMNELAILAYASTGFAVAAAAGGLAVGVAAAVANGDANAFRVADSNAFDPTKISKADVRARIADINFKTKVTAICAAAAAVSAGVAAWLRPGAGVPGLATDGETIGVVWRF